MNCSRVQDLLPDYSVENLDARTRQAVATHLSACAGCREELRVMDAVMLMVEQEGVRQPPVGLFNAVRNRIESGEIVRQRPAWWGFLFTGPARAAAMGLSMAAVAFGLVAPTGFNSAPPSLPIHPEAGIGVGGSSASGALGSSIRQHAMSATDGPLADRVAWEALAQLAAQEKGRKERKAD